MGHSDFLSSCLEHHESRTLDLIHLTFPFPPRAADMHVKVAGVGLKIALRQDKRGYVPTTASSLDSPYLAPEYPPAHAPPAHTRPPSPPTLNLYSLAFPCSTPQAMHHQNV